MFSSAKCGSHGLSASLDSSYPSLMASAVGADRFWQIDLGCPESEIYERRAAERSAALFVFLSCSADESMLREYQPCFLPEFFLYQFFLLRFPTADEDDPPGAFEPPFPLPLRAGSPPHLPTIPGRNPFVFLCGGGSVSCAESAAGLSSWFPVLFGIEFFSHLGPPPPKGLHLVTPTHMITGFNSTSIAPG